MITNAKTGKLLLNMIVKQLDNIKKKDSFLYYRNNYCADAVFEYGKNSQTETASVEFSIEKTAIGDTIINVMINSSINYPMLPAIKSLKQFVSDMQTEGSLN